ncbi:hypothetical protein CO674_23950 [Rhizobium hidalgonense]|uniref:site-specific DNA-methyltransferase (cytosine-N(4)-specific) n=2 Tax=Rhizobium hidalgonense TaxID=1538159 RepID=A0ABX4JQT3_9HYPH|nr:hypothetical protein CO674_23950 [Rhizobium hidalgonense]PON07954.1 hypothetical protein ATY29_09485 [Rhizobium hidalgonense]
MSANGFLAGTETHSASSAAENASDDRVADQRGVERSKPWVAYPVDTSLEFDRFVGDYAVKQAAIQVSFRNLVHWIKGERASHYIHPYPAKLLAHIAHFFLAARRHVPRGAVVLDPFSGSGTVALETVLAGNVAYWSDVNPLARAITKAKITRVNLDELESAFARVQTRYIEAKDVVPPEVVNIGLWYSEETTGRLARLRGAIEGEPEGDVTDLLWVIFSGVARACSRADPRFSVPVRRKAGIVAPGRALEDDPNVWDLFDQAFRVNSARISTLELQDPLGENACVGDDARSLRDPSICESELSAASVDLIITSPPYAGAQKYIRSSSLSIGWLGMASVQQMRALDSKSIGRERFSKNMLGDYAEMGMPEADAFIRMIAEKNAMRAAVVFNYLVEMSQVFVESRRVLRPGGRLVMIVGNNTICGENFETSEFMKLLALRSGFEVKLELVDTIKGRGLMTARNKTSAVIMREWVLVFERRPDESDQ